MTKFTLEVDPEDAEKIGQDSGEFVLPPPGYYVLRIVEANAGFSKTEGEEDKTKPRIEVVYEIDGIGMDGAGEVVDNYGRLWDYITFGKGYAGQRRGEFGVALGLGTKEEFKAGKKFKADTDELIERKVIGRIKHEKDKVKSEEEKKTVMRARLASILPLSAADGAIDTSGGEVDFGSEDEDATTDVDPFAEEAPADDGAGDLLTEEELLAMEPKDLSNVCKEFDLDPQSLIVKYTSGANKGKVNVEASKKAMAEAVLEAQNGPAGGDDADDGDPF